METKDTIRIAIWGMSDNIGGIETFVMNVYRNIDREKVQFDFLCAHNSPKIAFEDEIVRMGGRIYRIMYSETESLIKARTCLKKFFAEHKEIKGIHIHANFLYAFPLKYAKKAGIQLRILHSHNSGEINTETNKLKKVIFYLRRKQVERQIAKYPTKYLTCSDLAGDFMFKGKNYEWIKNGIKLKDFAFDEKVRKEYREKLDIADDVTVIGFIGRYREQKNPIYLLEIFKEYSKLNNKAVLLMIGIGELQESVDKKIEELELQDKVLQLGKREDTNKLYQMMDAFLLPSIYEGLPVVLVEAQTAGLVCLASDTITKQVAVTELVHYYSIAQTPKFWAEQMNELLNEYQRKDYSLEMKNAGFDMQDVAYELEILYKEIYSVEKQMGKITRNKNRILYIWQGIACIMILQMHVTFPGKIGEGLTFLGKFAVCLFFAISGYFLKEENNYTDISIIRKKVSKLLKIFIISFGVYCVYRLIMSTTIGEPMDFDIGKEILKLIIFNKTSKLAVVPLWFILALIYVYILYYIIQMFGIENKYKIMFGLSILSIVISYIFRLIAVMSGNENMYYEHIYLFRNWIFFGIPMFTLGCLLRKNRNKIKGINPKKAVGIIVAGFFMEVLEAYVIRLGVDFYIGSIVVVIGIFILAQNELHSNKFRILERIGEKYSLFIYLWHVLVMYLLSMLLNGMNLQGGVIEWLMPILVLAICVIIATSLDKIKQVKERRK